MNNKKIVYSIACVLFIAVHGAKAMELAEYKFYKPSITQDNIFLWERHDQQYHALAIDGVYNKCILQKSDQARKQYRAQLVVQENDKSFLRITQKRADDNYYNGAFFENLRHKDRYLVHISISDKQVREMLNYLTVSYNKKEAIIAADNCNNMYFITHIANSKISSSKKNLVQKTLKRNSIKALKGEIELLRKDNSNLHQFKVTAHRLISGVSLIALFGAFLYQYYFI